ncbi:S-adenosyl-L-methionine-dependent methyltransferase [Auricularia subglabra TFB-10046 SS5]|nr:S-adenosyl-L-methionine-dependent methyltransferase [Auricularia subglabra TFB-10046 SS5]
MPHQELPQRPSPDEFVVAKPRFFNDPENSVYLLPADSEERRRLNLQHANLVSAAGGKLLFAPIDLKDGDRALDCATGTGVWLLDILSRSPEGVSFTGIDLSSHLFPDASITPANASFLRHSILDLPESWTSTYTLIHQRLLIAALRTEEWPKVIAGYFRALQPGGWIQLCEVYPAGCIALGPRTARVRGMQRELMRLRGLDFDCAPHLEGWARQAGFINIEKVQIKVPVGVRAGKGPRNYTEGSIEMFLAMKVSYYLRVNAGVVGSEEEYVAAVAEMREEWDTIDDAHVPFYYVWAQKPAFT